ncbi:MAG: glycosyltransferase [Oscillospiraceae bacterium]|nr:glycosyltransferase [Oscillospiraceae bacterium]
MSDHPIVSVIIPVFNGELYLRECLDSIVNQTLKDIEIICIDDGSTDGTASILQEYCRRDDRLRVITHKENMTASISRKEGVLQAAGKNIWFIDADDYVELDACEWLSREMEHSGAEILHFQSDVVATEGVDLKARRACEEYVKPFFGRIHGEKIVDACFSQKLFQFTLWNKFFSAELLKRSFAMVEDIPLPIAQDKYAFFIISYYARSYCGVASPAFYHYRYGSGITGKMHLSREQFRRYCRMGDVSRAMERFLSGQADGSAYRDALKSAQEDLLSHCVYVWDDQLSEEEKKWGFAELLLGWSAEQINEKIAAKRRNCAPKTLEWQPTVKVSVIIPAFNAATYLPQCLDSLIVQTLRDIEIICVDDASTDSTPDVLRTYMKKDSRIRFFRHDHNQRETAARKLGVENARGKYILFLDADDSLVPVACETVYREMESRGVEILQFNTNIFCGKEQDTNRIRNLAKFLRPYEGKLTGRDVFRGCFDEQVFGFTIWNKGYSTKLCKKAFRHIKPSPMPIAGDEYSFFILSYYADSYVGLPDEYLYNYNFGLGVTGGTQLTGKEFDKFCTAGKVVEEIQAFLFAREHTEESVRIMEKTRAQLRRFCVGDWNLYCRDEDKAKEFDEMLRNWPAAEVVAEVARIFWTNKPKAVSYLKDAAIFHQKNRKVKRIGVYYHSLSIGGAQQVTAQLIRMWTSMGYECVLLTDQPPKENEYPLPEGVHREVIPSYFSLTPENYLYRARRLEDIVRQYELDAIVYHAWVATCLLWDTLLFKCCGTSVVIHAHSVFSFMLRGCSPDWGNNVPAVQMADAMITLSGMDRFFWEQFNPRVFTVVNPIFFDVQRQPQASLKNNIVLWVGRFSEEKRPYDAIRIMKEVVSRFPDAKLVMVGDSETDPGFLEKIRIFAEENGIKDSVVFTGFQDDVFPFYLSASVFLMTSDYEGFALTLLEAGACGLPAVMYRLPYLPLVQGNRGIVSVETGDTKAASREVTDLLRDKEKRVKMGKAAREHILAFSGFDYLSAWKEIFDSLERQGSGACVTENGKLMWDTLFEHYRTGAERSQRQISRLQWENKELSASLSHDNSGS